MRAGGCRRGQALLGLARKGEGYVVEDVLRTNVFHITVAEVDHTGLYADIAVGFSFYSLFGGMKEEGGEGMMLTVGRGLIMPVGQGG